MPVPIFTVDAFTAQPFRGNPAAVCLLDGPADEPWMAQVAAEMNLSETAYAHRSGGGYGLRWFTPAVEVALCGHATLATAHVLWESGRVARTEAIVFDTASGSLTATCSADGIELDFPLRRPVAATAPEALARALGAQPRWVGRADHDWLVELDAPATVAALQPDAAALAGLGGHGLIVTAAGGEAGHDFTSRYFAPAIGLPEDPVTGSAHCALAPYWADRLGRSALVGYQASARGGEVRVRLDGQRVVLGGRAVIVLAGELTGA